MNQVCVNIPWANELANILPARIFSLREELGEDRLGELLEILIHGEIRKIFRDLFPVSEMIFAEENISQFLGSQSAKEAIDFMLVQPWSLSSETRVIAGFLEVKRTYPKRRNKKAIFQDMARLAICSKENSVPAYFALCGLAENVIAELSEVDIDVALGGKPKTLDWRDGIEGEPGRITSVKKRTFGAAYRKLLEAKGISTVRSHLLKAQQVDNVVTLIWRITANDEVFSTEEECLSFCIAKPL